MEALRDGASMRSRVIFQHVPLIGVLAFGFMAHRLGQDMLLWRQWRRFLATSMGATQICASAAAISDLG